MKKHIFLFALLVSAFTFSLQAQQGKWAGTIKYQLTWTGDVPQGIPSEYEVKVFEEKTKYMDMTMGAVVITDAQKKNVTLMFDFSQIPLEDVSGKWYIREKVADSAFALVTYNFTGKTKEMAGKTAHEVVATFKNAEGVEETETFWACKDLGPTVEMTNYPGLQAMPFEYTVQYAETLSCTFTAVEVIEGKVKKTDLLLETGYEELTMEEFQEKIQILQEAMGGGAEEDF
ncbi:MAG: hypothetical protein J6U84_07165 [Bacteroidales bacterium]|nr:hypothetical protein [Bacteroidales bacterium]